MPKPNHLNDLFLLQNQEANPVKDHFLYLLGTDTVFTPKPTIPEVSYERGETLSYAAQAAVSVLGEEATRGEEGEPLSYCSPSVDVLNGPTTFGTEVGDRIAQGVFLALRAAASGKTNLLITAHSRGAVEAILVMHELERIKKALNDCPEKLLLEVLKETPCAYTKAAFSKFKDSEGETHEQRASLLNRLSNLKINPFLIDPVPGGRYKGIPGTAWRDKRFYDELICDHYELILYLDERTCCFIPAVPKGMLPTAMPGHHGTGSGNLYNQQFVLNSKKEGVETVQNLLLCKLLYFFQQRTTVFSAGEPHDINLEHAELDHVAKTWLSANEAEQPGKMLEYYCKVQENNKIFRAFAEGSYAVLGREYTKDNQRYVHFRGHNYYSMSDVSESFENFVNSEHVMLYLKDYISFNPDDEPEQLVAAITLALGNTINQMNEHCRLEESVGASSLLALIRNQEQSKLFFNALSAFVDVISQKYLRNHLDKERKNKLLLTIKKPFDILLHAQKDRGISENDKAILTNCQSVLEDGVKNTLKTHYQTILEQSHQLLEKTQYYLASDSDFKKDFKNYLNQFPVAHDDEKIKEILLDIKKCLTNIEPTTVEKVQNDIGEILKPIEENEDLTLEQKEELNTLVFNKHYHKLQAYFEACQVDSLYYLHQLDVMYESLDSLHESYPELQSLLNGELGIDQEQLHLFSLGLIEQGAKLLKEKNYNLRNCTEGISKSFFEAIKKNAIAIGMVDPLIDDQKDDIQEKAQAIDELKQTLEDKQGTVEDRTRHIEVLGKQIEQKDGDMAGLNKTIEHKDGNIAALHKTIEHKDEGISNLEREMKSQQQEMEQQQQTLEESRQLLEEKNWQIKALNFKKEQQAGVLINEKLLPLTEDYLKHLYSQAKKYNPILQADAKDEPLPELENNLDYDKIKTKFDIVYAMKKNLTDDNMEALPGNRVKEFKQQLTNNEDNLQLHRDPKGSRWARTCLAAIAILLTGIVPGVIGLGIYTAVSGKKAPMFFNHHSRGEHFTTECKDMMKP